ncbi:MIF4G domain-containing protein B [Lucilia cuprina]|nr:MIF4G domain-containing protein B [Lucilia cuprina]
MADKVEQTQQMNNNQNDVRKIRKSPEFQTQQQVIVPASITRERSFVRTSNHQNINKRRSLAFNLQTGGNTQTVQLRGKPTMDIYRPPNARYENGNNLNVNAQEFNYAATTNTRSTTPPPPPQSLVQSAAPSDAIDSRSSMVFPLNSPTGIQPQMQYVATNNAMMNRRQAGLSLGSMPLGNMNKQHHMAGGHRPILVTHSHPMQMGHMGVSQQVPLINSPSSGNILHQAATTNRVKFAPEPQKHHHNKGQMNMVQMNNNLNQNYQQHQQMNVMNPYIMSNNQMGNGPMDPYMNIAPLQRSKSLSSADALTRGIAGLGLGLGNEVTDIGQFTPEIQSLIDTALEDPNKLNSRSLMELTSHFIKRAVEGRRYALPISRLCLNIIAKEQKETFLEALLNTCRQWYQEREKLLFTIQGMKSPSRARFTAFMAFLTEMFCQLKRRQLQLRTQCEGAPPPLVLLTLLSKCCEDCVKPPVRSLSEIECLFYVLTCIGQDLEMQLPQQLELLLSMVRDAFLNASDSAPAIRRTLLQLIELQASHWQLPGNTVLYYYPSNK